MPTAVEVARANGIKIPVVAWECSQRVGVPYAVTCAFLEQESSGGLNVFGHDGGWFSGAGAVTKAKYLTYRDGRDEHNAQGVGPMQLTWPPFQDAADALGGCWVPTHNVTQGLRVLKGFIDQGKTWHQAAALYNGSEAYADQVDAKITRWRQLLAGATNPGGHDVDPYELIPYHSNRYSDGSPMLVTRRLDQALDRLQRLLGYTDPLTMYQGCNHDGSKSAGTHSGADVVDLSDYDYQRKAEIGASIGLIVFHRPPNWDGAGGGAHLHCLLRGSKRFSAEAAQQVRDWDNHIDGLAGHDRRYTGPWFPVKPFVWHENYGHDTQPPPPHDPPGAGRPLADAWLRATHAASIAGQAFTAAHPNMFAYAALSKQQAAEAAAIRRLTG